MAELLVAPVNLDLTDPDDQRARLLSSPFAHPKHMGCMRDEDIQSFETKLPRMRRVRFEGLLSGLTWASLFL